MALRRITERQARTYMTLNELYDNAIHSEVRIQWFVVSQERLGSTRHTSKIIRDPARLRGSLAKFHSRVHTLTHK